MPLLMNQPKQGVKFHGKYWKKIGLIGCSFWKRKLKIMKLILLKYRYLYYWCIFTWGFLEWTNYNNCFNFLNSNLWCPEMAYVLYNIILKRMFLQKIFYDLLNFSNTPLNYLMLKSFSSVETILLSSSSPMKSGQFPSDRINLPCLWLPELCCSYFSDNL